MLQNYYSSLHNNQEEHSTHKNVLTNFSNSIHLSVPELYVVRDRHGKARRSILWLLILCVPGGEWLECLQMTDFLGRYTSLSCGAELDSHDIIHTYVLSPCALVSHHENILNCNFNLVTRCH